MSNLKFLTTKIKDVSIPNIAILLLPIIIVGGFLTFFINQNILPTLSSEKTHLIIGHALIDIEIVDTQKKQIQGLSDRKNMEPNTGMLFVFKEKQQRSFWMKNMHFPIDIIWIDDYTIVGIDKRLEPEGEKPKKTYPSHLKVDKVLEVNGGFSDAFDIKIGDKIKF